MSRTTIQMDENLHEYLTSVSVRESEVLQRLRDETAEMEAAAMQISPEQGQFMGLLVRMMGAQRAIEIGTFTGYSAICMAEALPEDGRLVCCDVSKEWTDIARRYWEEAGVAEKIDLEIGDALQTLKKLEEAGFRGTFDFAFIDADKVQYNEYYESCLRLLRPGGLVAVDNTLWGGKVADPEVTDEETEAIRRVNEKIFRDGRVFPSMIPIGDGLTLALKQ